MNYSLFMAVIMVLMLERVEKRSGATPAAFPSPIFAGTASVSVFLLGFGANNKKIIPYGTLNCPDLSI
jgi:hypothetical protein